MIVRVAIVSLLAGTIAFAQLFPCPSAGPLAAGGNSIGTIPNGATLSGSESWYDSTTGALQVVVLKNLLPPGCEIRVQGMTPTQKPSGLWVVEVPLDGPLSQWQTPPFIYQGLLYGQIPNIAALSDRQRTMKTLVQELVDLASETVLSRTQIVIYDKRNDSGFDPHFSGSLTHSLGSELSHTGVEKLEPVHASSLPAPSLSAFNTVLTNYFSGTKWSILPPVNFGNNDKACIPLANVDPDFLQTEAYKNVKIEADLQYVVWEAADQACQSPNPLISLPGCAAAALNCVRDRTRNARNFELCVRRIEGTGKTLQLAGIDSAELAINNTVPLTSRVNLGRLDSTLDGVMGEMFIRWSDKHVGCATRPRENLSAADEGRSVIAAWKSCTGLEADATGARTQGPIHHSLPVSLETLSATAVDATPPLFALNANRPKNPDKGSCALPEFRDHVTSLLDLYYPSIETAVNANWLGQHGVAMDNLMSRWETGVWENAPDVNLIHNLRAVKHRANDRITMHSDSDAVRQGSFGRNAYSTPDPFPCFDPIAPGANSLPCVMGLSIYNQPFDASFTVTTNALNQVLRERRNDLVIVPTFDQLNATPPAGKVGTDLWELDGAQLSALFPAFSTLGSTKLRMAMGTSFAPYTYIPADPLYWFNNGVISFNGVPPGRAPLTYQMGQYYVTLIGDQPGPDGKYEWFEFRAEFYDPNFQVRAANSAQRNTLVPSFSDKFAFTFVMTKSQLTNCPVRPFPVKQAGCGELLTAAMGQLVGKLIKDTAIGVLSGFPVPQYYDASGTASTPVRFNQQDKYQQKQVITFYGDLQ